MSYQRKEYFIKVKDLDFTGHNGGQILEHVYVLDAYYDTLNQWHIELTREEYFTNAGHEENNTLKHSSVVAVLAGFQKDVIDHLKTFRGKDNQWIQQFVYLIQHSV